MEELCNDDEIPELYKLGYVYELFCFECLFEFLSNTWGAGDTLIAQTFTFAHGIHAPPAAIMDSSQLRICAWLFKSHRDPFRSP